MKRARDYLTGLSAIAMLVSFPLGLLYVITSLTGFDVAHFLKIFSVTMFAFGASSWAMLQVIELVPHNLWKMFSPSRVRCWFMPAHREAEDCREFRVPSSPAAQLGSLLKRQPLRNKLAILAGIGCIFMTVHLAGEKFHVGPEAFPPAVDYPEMDFPHPNQVMCVPGTVESCGPTVGECRSGDRTCGFNSFFGVCVGALGPIFEIPGDGRDNDCDGEIDEEDVTQYHVGVATCDNSRQWAACQPAVYPPEVCDGMDDNCDGDIAPAPVSEAQDDAYACGAWHDSGPRPNIGPNGLPFYQEEDQISQR